MSVGKYQSEQFRETELQRLFDLARAGESASIIGVSGVGKSNLFNHLQARKTQQQYLKEDEFVYLFLRVNFHYLPDFSERSVYSLILDQIELLGATANDLEIREETITEIGRYHDLLLDAGDDLLKVQRYFKLAIRQIMAQSQRKLVFLFDQFDELYQEVEPRLLVNLRGLREDFKYRISYFVFTRNLLTLLMPMDEAREEFYELLSANIIGLKPYNLADVNNLLDRVTKRYRYKLTQIQRESLISLSGGHGGILRTSLLVLITADGKRVEPGILSPESLIANPAVKMECEKIWRSLAAEEQQLLIQISNEIPAHDQDPSLEQLKLKGLLGTSNPPQIFSPIFIHFVLNQANTWDQAIKMDEPTRRVWVWGKPTSPLTALEFRVFRLLYEYVGEVVERDEIVEAGWPDAEGGVTDTAVNQMVRRLREKIEPDRQNPQFLESVRGQGYRLNTENSLL